MATKTLKSLKYPNPNKLPEITQFLRSAKKLENYHDLGKFSSVSMKVYYLSKSEPTQNPLNDTYSGSDLHLEKKEKLNRSKVLK